MLPHTRKSFPILENTIYFKSTYENHLKMEKSETKRYSNACRLIVSCFLSLTYNEYKRIFVKNSSNS